MVRILVPYPQTCQQQSLGGSSKNGTKSGILIQVYFVYIAEYNDYISLWEM